MTTNFKLCISITLVILCVGGCNQSSKCKDTSSLKGDEFVKAVEHNIANGCPVSEKDKKDVYSIQHMYDTDKLKKHLDKPASKGPAAGF
ncbi:hypothetical protein [Fundidesulfovibrio putealis]|uniref:hypothetical protein n=1 Tax=Fundidesulfovibrio putealis TaxID=270496 RepID=UPI00048061BF|nr:hypothetical protein [Fundidesulfovibrio putealis]